MAGFKQYIIKLVTRSDTKGAKEVKQALEDVVDESEKAGNEIENAGGRIEDVGASGSNAIEGMSGNTVALAAGVISVAAAWMGVKVAIQKAREAMEEAGKQQVLDAQQVAIIEATGGAAGQTAGELERMRSELSDLTKVADESIERAQNLMLTFTNVQDADIFTEATERALDMAAVFGGDASQSALQLGKALNDPILGLTALRESGISFSETQTEMIKGMVAAGDTMGAQREILAELKREFGGAAEAAGTTLAGAMQAVSNASKDAKQAFGSWIGNTRLARGVMSFLEDSLRGVESAFKHIGPAAREAKIEFDAAGQSADDIEKSMRALAGQDLGQLPATAAALAQSLKEAGENAGKATEQVEALARAELQLAEARIEQEVAQGKITKEEGERRKLGLRRGAGEASLDRQVAASRSQFESAQSAQAAIRGRQQSAKVDFKNASQVAGYFDGFGDPYLKSKANAKANAAQKKLEALTQELVDAEQIVKDAKANYEVVKRVTGLQRETLAVRTDTGVTRTVNAERDAAQQAEAKRLQEEQRALEEQKRAAEKDFKAGTPGFDSIASEERAQAEAAQSNLQRFQQTGEYEGRRYSRKGFSGRQIETQLQAEADKQIAEAEQAVQAINDRARANMQRMQDIVKRIANIEGQIDNLDT